MDLLKKEITHLIYLEGQFIGPYHLKFESQKKLLDSYTNEE